MDSLPCIYDAIASPPTEVTGGFEIVFNSGTRLFLVESYRQNYAKIRAGDLIVVALDKWMGDHPKARVTVYNPVNDAVLTNFVMNDRCRILAMSG